MLTQITDEIFDYIEFLKKEYSFDLSLHPRNDDDFMSSNKLIRFFNNHTNPYCMYIKTNTSLWQKCVQCQEKVFDRCKDGFFFGMCHAGVEEYVFPVMFDGNVKCFISISGYRTKANGIERAYKRAHEYSFPKDAIFSAYMSGLSDKVPSRKELLTIISPLVRMLEYAYLLSSKYPKDSSSPCSAIIHYINMHYTEDISLSDISEHFNYSKSYVSHIFKKRNGKSVPEYINSLRIDSAKEMLKYSCAPIEHIALASGFSDPNYFSSAFKKHTGTSPLKYRQSHRQNKA